MQKQNRNYRQRDRNPDAGRVLLSILSQLPADELGRYTLLAAQRVDDIELSDDLYDLAADPREAERLLLESVAMNLTYCDLRPEMRP